HALDLALDERLQPDRHRGYLGRG
ncbi:MAG: hypothetical protein QOG99_2407, partial [Frankiales bacterium]|nr:hypothetical protein [Frankiales bacterium]